MTLAPLIALALFQSLSNPSFESGRIGSVPDGWFQPPVTREAGYIVEATNEDPYDGARCVRISWQGEGSPESFGNLMQSLPAAPFRGRNIRLRAAVRVEGPGARGQVWVRIDREGGKPGFFDNMGNRPVRSKEWQVVELEGFVHHDAVSINLGVFLLGTGTAWADAFALEATSDVVAVAEPEGPRELEGRALDNLLAFAELFGYVRHFHPSDEAEDVDWDLFAIEGARAVESASDSGELAERLLEVFGPVAPTLRVEAGSKVEAAPELERPSGREVYVRWWRHVGFGQHDLPQNIYSSTRMKERVERRSLPKDVPDPAQPFRAELAGGVTCVVPLALWADAEGTLPHAEDARATPASHTAGEMTADDRATRLAAVILAWNVFQHFYPYFDVVDTDWRAELERALVAAATDVDEDAFLRTLRHLVAALHDGHGGVVMRAEPFAGFLPLDWDWVDDDLVVTYAPNVRGAAPGDVVVAIDGRPVSELAAEASALVSGATPQWIRHRVAIELATCREPGKKKLELRSYAKHDRKVTVEVEPVRQPVDEKDLLPEAISEPWAGVVYVDLDRVTNADLAASMPRLADAEGIVFDLRGYPSGLAPASFLSHLTSEPVTSPLWNVPVVTRPNREDVEWELTGIWNLPPIEPLLEAPRAFLTGGGAISYAESCLGIVEHYRLAEIVGGPTAGTNGNINPFRVPGGYGITWTGMKVLKHDGSQHHGVGILPTVPVKRTRAGIAEGRDELLEKAIEVVLE